MKLLHFDSVDGRLGGKRGLVFWRAPEGKIVAAHLILTWTGRRKELMLFDYDHYVALSRREWWLRLEWTPGWAKHHKRPWYRDFKLHRGVCPADQPDLIGAPHRMVRLIR